MEHDSKLKIIGTITIPAITEKFFPRKKFIVNTKRNAIVKISEIGREFAVFFYDICSIEEPKDITTLCYYELKKGVELIDDQIIDELGMAKAETTLSEIFALMELQKDGEKGALLVDGRSNIFFVRCFNSGSPYGSLRGVGINRSYGRWAVWAFHIKSVHGIRYWNGIGERDRFFSRNSNWQGKTPPEYDLLTIILDSLRLENYIEEHY